MNQQSKQQEKPAYSFIDALEQIDQQDCFDDLKTLMQILSIDRHLYTAAQQQSIGTKLQEKYIVLKYGVCSN